MTAVSSDRQNAIFVPYMVPILYHILCHTIYEGFDIEHVCVCFVCTNYLKRTRKELNAKVNGYIEWSTMHHQTQFRTRLSDGYIPLHISHLRATHSLGVCVA